MGLLAELQERFAKHPTGTVEVKPKGICPEGALSMRGQVYSRWEFPALWEWARDHDQFSADGTTFTLPNLCTNSEVEWVIWT